MEEKMETTILRWGIYSGVLVPLKFIEYEV